MSASTICSVNISVEMRSTRRRELTRSCHVRFTISNICRNEKYPKKGIDVLFCVLGCGYGLMYRNVKYDLASNKI